MAVYKQSRSKYWWYKFTWNGELIRESTKQTNKRVAEQMEAAHKTALAKGEVGIRERKPAPTLQAFAERDFLPYVEATFDAKRNTLRYYDHGVKVLLAFSSLASLRLDAITGEDISRFVADRLESGRAVASVNRELQALRRMFALAQEWRKVEKALPRVRMIAGERHRERVITAREEASYLAAAPALLRDVATILVDCGLRPEECFRLRRDNVRGGVVEILSGKTDSARRRIPASGRVAAILDIRLSVSESEWVFPAPTQSGHIESSSVKKQQLRAFRESGVKPFELYTLRHTCLTRWAPHMDPWTLHQLAGHRDMSITKRYIHPQEQTIREAIERAREANSGHTFGHTGASAESDASIQ